jgi:hypothetical protein
VGEDIRLGSGSVTQERDRRVGGAEAGVGGAEAVGQVGGAEEGRGAAEDAGVDRGRRSAGGAAGEERGGGAGSQGCGFRRRRGGGHRRRGDDEARRSVAFAIGMRARDGARPSQPPVQRSSSYIYILSVVISAAGCPPVD